MLVQVEIEPPIATLTLAHPPVNALSYAVREALLGALERLGTDPAVRAVVLTGDPSVRDVFCGGADVREFELDEAAGGGAERTAREMAFVDRLRRQRLPLVAAVNGPALGGGLELALACDVVVAAAGARFGFPEIQLGVFPGSLALPLALGALGPHRTRFLALSGRQVDAAWMAAAGAVAEVVERAELLPRARALAREIGAVSAGSVAAVREVVDLLDGAGPAARRLVEAHSDRVFRSPEARERVRAFLERHRRPE
jgi:enoyl-CoA hydratase/carnithine racemase